LFAVPWTSYFFEALSGDPDRAPDRFTHPPIFSLCGVWPLDTPCAILPLGLVHANVPFGSSYVFGCRASFSKQRSGSTFQQRPHPSFTGFFYRSLSDGEYPRSPPQHRSFPTGRPSDILTSLVARSSSCCFLHRFSYREDPSDLTPFPFGARPEPRVAGG